MNNQSTLVKILMAISVCLSCRYVQAQEVDVLHQIIQLTPDWNKEQLHAKTDISLQFTSASSKLVLDGSQLLIESVKTSDGKGLSFVINDPSPGKINITLDKKYRKTETLKLSIAYTTTYSNQTDPVNIWGSLGKGVRFFKPSSTEPERQKQIWSVGEPEGNLFWFPSVHSPTDFRTTELIITLEKPLKAISNGILKEATDNGDGTQTYHWKTEVPHAPHLTSFVAGSYLDVNQQYNGAEIHSFCYPHEADATAATVERLPDMMRYFSEVTGVEYPYPSYSQVFVQEFVRWQGNMMTTTITENMVDDYVTHKDFRYLWDIVESQALASQWFGSHLVPRSTSDVWLSKAFSTYLSGLYNEYKNGKEEFLPYQYNPQQLAYLGDWNSRNIQPIVNTKFEDAATFSRSNHPSLHGATVLHMLRKQLGDVVWLNVLKAYTQFFAGKNVSTADFQKTAERVSGKNLDPFFQQWVYGVGHPVFEVKKQWNSNTKALTLTVKQIQRLDTLQTAHATTRYFEGKTQLEIDGSLEDIYLKAQAENSFEFKRDIEPNFVNFDFEDSWVKELRYEQSTEEHLNTLLHSKDILARIASMGQLTTISNQEDTSDLLKERIYASIRSVIMDDGNYWRLKMRALWQLQGSMLDASGNLTLDPATKAMLLHVIQDEESWVKSSAIWFLGMTKDPQYVQLYMHNFEDWSDRVTNAAAIALGKTKSPLAFDALVALQHKPSWKNQSLISALNGLQWLGDTRGTELALYSLINNEATHWTLATPIWDHRQAASLALAGIGANDKGHDLIMAQLKKAMKENDLNDVFYNALQVVHLADPRGAEVFDLLKERYALDKNAMIAIAQLEQQYKAKMN